MGNPWDNDAEFEDSLITKAEGDNGGGWSITKTDGWSFWVPADSPVAPAIDMPIRMYPRGIGSPIRGLFLDGQCVFYRTKDEQAEYFANQQYGKDAAEVLSRWDEGRSVWSISMGGFGPGYEQALQIATFEVLRYLLAGNPIETTESLLDGLGYLGLSGAQWGAAKMLGNAFSIKTPRQIHEDYPRDRHIQVRKNFPVAPEARDRTRYLLSEVIGTFQEYDAMPCASLLARLRGAVTDVETYLTKEATS